MFFKKKIKDKIGDVKVKFHRNANGSISAWIYVYGYDPTSAREDSRWVFCNSFTDQRYINVKNAVAIFLDNFDIEEYMIKPGIIEVQYVRS